MIDLLRILDRIEQAGATSSSLTEPIDTKTLTPEDEADLVRLWRQGTYTMDTMAKIFNSHPSIAKRAIYRVYKSGHSSLK